MHIRDLAALLKSIILLGLAGKERFYYWRVFFWSLFHRPTLFPMAITHAVYGYHFRRVFADAAMKFADNNPESNIAEALTKPDASAAVREAG